MKRNNCGFWATTAFLIALSIDRQAYAGVVGADTITC
jgi:hypothetical protein